MLAALLLGAVTTLFILASYQRAQLATSLGRSDAATRPVHVGSLMTTLAERLNYAAYLGRGIERADHSQATSDVGSEAKC